VGNRLRIDSFTDVGAGGRDGVQQTIVEDAMNEVADNLTFTLLWLRLNKSREKFSRRIFSYLVIRIH
jgi:hypothetical protein